MPYRKPALSLSLQPQQRLIREIHFTLSEIPSARKETGFCLTLSYLLDVLELAILTLIELDTGKRPILETWK
jgi:hypothetical protein